MMRECEQVVRKYWLVRIQTEDIEPVPGPARFEKCPGCEDSEVGLIAYDGLFDGQPVRWYVPDVVAWREGDSLAVECPADGKQIRFDVSYGETVLGCVIDLAHYQPDNLKQGFYQIALEPDGLAIEKTPLGEVWLTFTVMSEDDREACERIIASLPDLSEAETELGFGIRTLLPGAVIVFDREDGSSYPPAVLHLRYGDDVIKDAAMAMIAKGELNRLRLSAVNKAKGGVSKKLRDEDLLAYAERKRAETNGVLPHGWIKEAASHFGITSKTLSTRAKKLGIL